MDSLQKLAYKLYPCINPDLHKVVLETNAEGTEEWSSGLVLKTGEGWSVFRVAERKL